MNSYSWIGRGVLIASLQFMVTPVAAESCPDYLASGIQTHDGHVDFAEGAVLSGNPGGLLPAAEILGAAIATACGGEPCNAFMPTEELDIPSYPYSADMGAAISVLESQTRTITADDGVHFSEIVAGSDATVTFGPSPGMFIGRLALNYNSVVRFGSGDYWIGSLELQPGSRIEVSGTGSVRLIVSENLTLPTGSFVGLAGMSDRLLILARGDVSVQTAEPVHAALYALGMLALDPYAQVVGRVSGADVSVGAYSQVTYDSQDISSLLAGTCPLEADIDSDGVPDALDLDRDGDGVNNEMELLAGTNPDMPDQTTFSGESDDQSQAGDIYGPNQCVASLDSGLQSHWPAGVIDFAHDAQLLQSPSPWLPAVEVINKYNSRAMSCDMEFCYASGQPSDSFPLIVFPENTSSEDIFLATGKDRQLGAADAHQYRKVELKPRSTLTLAGGGAYKIKELQLGSDAELVVAPGDYWIDTLGMGASSRLSVSGTGTARIFVAGETILRWGSALNAGGNPAQLFFFSQGALTVNATAHIAGFIYVQDKVDAGSRAQIDGALAGGAIRLSPEAKVVFDAAALHGTDFGWICDLDGDGTYDGFDEDRDGDGISNDYEIQAGTNPNDPTSVPPDMDTDGIPDVLDDDRDGDGHLNTDDVFPDDATEWSDLDGDGIGDNSDADRDGDGISNDHETQLGFDPNDATSTPPDLDGDAIPDALDDDRDGDGHLNETDAFPDDATEWSDLDGDGIGDNSDADRDGDGISNDHETQLGFDPNDATSTPPDLDGDAIPDALDDDRDGDGRLNTDDVFPDDAAEWSDLDGDGIGDNSDPDRDGDGISNEYETQLGFDPNDATSTPPDLDGDAIPDALDDDRDGDGHLNEADAFPDDAAEWSDLDGDGIGDNSDADRDGDGISNDHETQLGFDPNDATSTPPDLDGDAIPDALDDDRDGDGHLNEADAFPDDAAEWSDLDGDGIGDNSDPDRDGDGISNDHETQLGFDPNDATSTPPDLDGDAIPDALDDDRDGDGHLNEADAFPDDATEWSDLDGDGIGDNSDADRDGDGISNEHETQLGFDPNDATSTPPDLDGDAIPDALDDDLDGDGHLNEADAFPDDAAEWSDLDGDGIGDNSDADRDGDGISNDHETQLGFDPNDAASIPPDLDGDAVPDALDDDRDGDGHLNNSDIFPDDAAEWSDLDGDGTGDNGDTDRDGDGFSNDDETAAGSDPDDPQDLPDATGPVLSVNGGVQQSTTQSSISLGGSATDDWSGVARIYATNDKIAGVIFEAVLVQQTWSLDMPLEFGANNLTLTALDGVGNSTGFVVRVERQVATVVYDLIIDSPAAGATVSQSSVVVTGRLVSESPVETPDIKVNGVSAAVSLTADPTVFSFRSASVQLQEGANALRVDAQVAGQLLGKTALVTYTPETQETTPPTIEIISPAPGSVVPDNAFDLYAEVTADAGIQSVLINGQSVPVPSGGRLNTRVSFASGESTKTVSLQIVDALDRSTTGQGIYYYDDQAPVLQVEELLPAPHENVVLENPYRIAGRVSDAWLSSLTLNGNPIGVTPDGENGGFLFSSAVQLPLGIITEILVEATDRAGNRTTLPLLIGLQSNIAIEWLAPADSSEYLAADEAGVDVQVSARIRDLSGVETVTLALDGVSGSETQVPASSGLVSTLFNVPGTPGDYSLVLSVKGSDGQTVAQASRKIQVSRMDAVPLQVIKVTPADGSSNGEPNQPVSVHLNKAISLEALTFEVHETAHGFTYIDQDPLGTDALRARGYQLEAVNRSHELVPGVVSLLPGGTTVVFYPARDFAYAGELYVTVRYAEEELLRSSFAIRTRPTFIEGGVLDTFGQPVANAEVKIEGLDRRAFTDSGGTFGLGPNDNGDNNLPAGRYLMTVNSKLSLPGFGAARTWINIEAGNRNALPSVLLPVLANSAPSAYLRSGQENVIGSIGMHLDASDAAFQFQSSTAEGGVRVQLLPQSAQPVPLFDTRYAPFWSYSVQPVGIGVEGNLQVAFDLPAFRGSHDYVPPEGYYVLLLGMNNDTLALEPVGVGMVQAGPRVVSVGVTHYSALDHITYAVVALEQQEMLARYAAGETGIEQLRVYLQTYQFPEQAAQ